MACLHTPTKHEISQQQHSCKCHKSAQTAPGVPKPDTAFACIRQHCRALAHKVAIQIQFTNSLDKRDSGRQSRLIAISTRVVHDGAIRVPGKGASPYPLLTDTAGIELCQRKFQGLGTYAAFLHLQVFCKQQRPLQARSVQLLSPFVEHLSKEVPHIRH